MTRLHLSPIFNSGEKERTLSSRRQGNRMRARFKLFFLSALCLLLIRPCHAGEKKPFWSRFSLKVTAGLGSDLPMGDVNDCLASFNNNEVFEAHREVGTGQVVGEIKTLGTGVFHGEAELRFDLTPRISFGIATSVPIRKRNESSVTYTIVGWAGPQVMTWTFRPDNKISYPIRLSAYYTLPLIRRLSISIGGGVGFYSAKISQFFRFDKISPIGKLSWSTWDQVAERNFAFGFHGNVVFEYLLNNRLGFVAEFQYGLTKISGFKGKLKSVNEHGDSFEKDGTLYYFTEWNYYIGTRHATLEIFKAPPEGGVRWINDLREAALDLSGYSMRLGINIRLF